MHSAVLKLFIVASVAFGMVTATEHVVCEGKMKYKPQDNRCECCSVDYTKEPQVGSVTKLPADKASLHFCVKECAMRVGEGAVYADFTFTGENIGDCRCFKSNKYQIYDSIKLFGKVPGSEPGTGGDPHIFKWNGQKFDFHGECDLVLFQAPEFAAGLGLDVHIRTTIEKFYSFIEEVAVKAGNFVVNVNKEGFWVDSELLTAFPAQSGPFRVTQKSRKDKEGKLLTVYDISIDGKESLRVHIPSSKFIFVKVLNGIGGFSNITMEDEFGSSQGLMGQFGTGKTLGRDGVTEFDDMEKFGMEWQVQPYEEMLFLTVREPQLPRVCKMPTKRSGTGRKLRENPKLRAKAEAACGHIDSGIFELCVDDVIATGDASIAEGY